MEPEWNGPGARERTQVLFRRAGAKTNIAVLLAEEDFQLRRRNGPPPGIAALGANEGGAIGQAVKKAHGGCGGEIRRKKTEMKGWLPPCRPREGVRQRL